MKNTVPLFQGQVTYDQLTLYLIKPSKYDEDGYVIRHWKGVLPSNTLGCLYGLSEDVRDREVLGQNLKWQIHAMDETVQKINAVQIIRRARRKKTKTIICLVGVQSNQFTRASDLALIFRRAGLDVLIGGFHVSGIMATLPNLTPELEKLKNAGVTLVGGEVEYQWENILRDSMNGKLSPIYHFLGKPPEISLAPISSIPENLSNSYVCNHFATLDCGRGCPYQCSFCTVINVQGRSMRFRSVDAVIEKIRENYEKRKITYYFFTDDNFCRNKNWELIFDRIIRMREEIGIQISFMMQVDTLSYRIPNFIEKAGKAGCTQVFIGMESLNEENLKAVKKNQNNSDNYKQLIDAYHSAGIVTHLAYIIGFPFDTEESVRSDMVRLRELGAEQASFFMLTPLPGSMDYKRFVDEKRFLDADLNNYDSFHATFQHANMRDGSWTRTYFDAWNGFYSADHMKRILQSVRREKYWSIFLNFIWYKNAILVEGGHPMVHGFFRLKGRRSRRPDYPLESRWNYFKRRAGDIVFTLKGWAKLVLEMEDVWLATRKRNPIEENMVREMMNLRASVSEWRNLRISELQQLYLKVSKMLDRSPEARETLRVSVPSKFVLWFRKWNVFSDSLTYTRRPMNLFWRQMFVRLKRGRFFKLSFLKMFFMSLQESILLFRFACSLIGGSSQYAETRQSS